MISYELQNSANEVSALGLSRTKGKPHLVPRTLCFALHCFSRNWKINEQLVVSTLLQNKLEEEASFLVHSGFCAKASLFIEALDRECYSFAVEFFVLFLNDPSSPLDEEARRTISRSLIWHFEHSLGVIELILYFLKDTELNYEERSSIVSILSRKLQKCNDLRSGFVYYVGNPIKICLLLYDFLNNSTSRMDPLRYEIEALKAKLQEIAA